MTANVPGPPELLPGCPDAIIDLQTDEGAALVGGQWRYTDARVQEIELRRGRARDPRARAARPNRTYDVVPHAEAADFDDSRGRVLSPPDTQLRLSTGRVCFNWYRIAVTIPERVGDFDPTGSSVVFEVVDRRLRRGLGQRRAAAWRSATPAGRSSAASTRRTASC